MSASPGEGSQHAEVPVGGAQLRALQETIKALEAQNQALEKENREKTQALEKEKQEAREKTQALEAKTQALEAEKQEAREKTQALEAKTQALEAENQAISQERDALAENLHVDMVALLRSKISSMRFNLEACVKRPLTYPAPFEILGDFESVREGILDELNVSVRCERSLPTRGGEVRKEVIVPAIPIVAPPRHGKSLLLDSVAAALVQYDMQAVTISFNGATSPSTLAEETESDVWLRVLWRLLDCPATGGAPSYSEFVDRYLEWQKNFCLQWGTLRDLLVEAGVISADKPMILLIDEVTAPGEKARIATGRSLKSFAELPLHRIVMTGFRTASLEAFSASGIPIRDQTWTLSSCRRFDKSVRLAHRIRALDKNFDDGRWQVSKSYPGLMGWWLEETIQGLSCDASAVMKNPPYLHVFREDFQRNVVHIENLLFEVMTKPAASSWNSDALNFAHKYNLLLPDQSLCFAPLYHTLMKWDENSRPSEKLLGPRILIPL
jgi:hypothetical protein